MGTLLRRRYMGGGSSLPYDAEIEYLQSSGNQWIEIESVKYNASNSYRIECGVMNLSTNATYNGWDAGGAFGFMGSKFTNGNGQHFGPTSVDIYADITLTINSGSSSLSNMTVIVNSDSYSNSRKHGSLGTYASNKGYHLFAMYSKNSIAGNTSERIYYCKLFINDSLVCDLIPVRVGTTGYMYDKISRQLLANAGTGDFILGSDKIRGGKYLIINMLCGFSVERRAA